MITNRYARILFLAALLGGGVSFAAEESPNLLQNGGFDGALTDKNMPEGWLFQTWPWTKSTGRIVIDPEVKQNGKGSVRVEQTNEEGRLGVEYAEKIPVQAGERYTLTGFIKTDFPPGSKGRAYLIINGYQNGQFTREVATRIIRESADWEPVTATFTVNQETALAVLCIKIDGRGAAWFDTLELKRTN